MDVYNQELTGNIVCSLTAACGGTNTSGGKVIVKVSKGGYCYRKTAHPRTPDEPQGYEDTEIADTLNIFDYTEARTPILVVEVKNGKDRANTS